MGYMVIAVLRFLAIAPSVGLAKLLQDDLPRRLLWSAPPDDPQSRRLQGRRPDKFSTTLYAARQDFFSAPPKMDVYYKDDDDNVVHVFFPGTNGNQGSLMPMGLKYGMTVELSGAKQNRSDEFAVQRAELAAPDSLQVASSVTADTRPIFVATEVHEVTDNSSASVAANNGNAGTAPKLLRALAIIVNWCGQKATVKASEANQEMFDTGKAVTWAATHDVCSGGQSTVTGKAIGPIDLCSQDSSFGGIWSVAQPHLQQNYNADFASHQYYIFIMPGDVLGAIGMGAVGAGISMLREQYYADAAMHLHEVGHNMFLHHSGVYGKNEYDDTSSAMGFCCHRRCYHFIHNWQLGWAEVAREHTYSEVNSNPNGLAIDILQTASLGASGVTVRDPSGTLPYIVLSYRGSSGTDALIPSGYQNTVAVHKYDGMHNRNVAAISHLMGQATVDSDLQIPGTDVIVKVEGYSNGIAQVKLISLNPSGPGPSPTPSPSPGPSPSPSPTPTPKPPGQYYPHSAVWTSYFSEEQAAGEITSQVMVGLGCRGQYCDEVRTAHNQSLLRLDLDRASWQQNRNDVAMMVCGAGQAVSRLKCEGAYCEKVTIQCAPVLGVESLLLDPALGVTNWVPSQQHRTGSVFCPDGSIVTGLQCAGTHCSLKKLNCMHVKHAKFCSMAGSCSSLGMMCGADACGTSCGKCDGSTTCLGNSGQCLWFGIKTDWLSEESHMGSRSVVATGMECKEKYCGSVRLTLVGLNIVQATILKSAWVSDNTGRRWPWNDEAEALAADCPPGKVVSSIECRSKHCDDLQLTCANPIGMEVDEAGEPWHGSDWFNEDTSGGQQCPHGFAMVGLECKKSEQFIWGGCFSDCGDYCTYKKLRCRQLVPVMRGAAFADAVAGAKVMENVTAPSRKVDLNDFQAVFNGSRLYRLSHIVIGTILMVLFTPLRRR